MNTFKNIQDFKKLKIQIASPKDIKEASHGEISKAETINYRTWRPEKDGLFCEKIFGPVKDWECYCGKYKKIRFKGIVCDKCGVEVTHSRVRRERMGHINLASPVVHLWFLKSTPSPLSVILEIPQKDLEAVVYFAKFLVTEIDPKKKKEALKNLKENIQKKVKELDLSAQKREKEQRAETQRQKEALKNKIKNKEALSLAQQELDVKLKTTLQKTKNQIKTEKEKIENLSHFLEEKAKHLDVLSTLTDEELFYLNQFGADFFFKYRMGAEAILKALEKLDPKKLVKAQKLLFKKTTSKQKKKKILHRIRILNGLLENEIDPSWLVLKNLPVIPPGLRPMVQLTGGRFATSDLNDLYRRVINRNNRLKKLIGLGAPEIILRNEKRMLQEAVDMLIDAEKAIRGKRKTMKRTPRSLSDLLRGKKGRFRRNLLGKRVDYSGRSVIVVGPELKLNECGLPKEIALEIFRPFILRDLMLKDLVPNIKSAKNLIDHRTPEVYDALARVTKDKYILLNRAPTLHKLSMQAFKPILIDSLAIRLHPCVCSGFNADFDGDQMGVHLPLSEQAQQEAKKLMLPSRNILKPSDGNPVILPAKEMAVGCFYLTTIQEQDLGKESKPELLPLFGTLQETVLAHETGKIKLRQLINVRLDGQVIQTSCGRILFNQDLPDEIEFINRPMDGNDLKALALDTLHRHGRKVTVKLIDSLKNIGFYGFTLSGISISMVDCGYLPEKERIIDQANHKALEIEENFKFGLITNEEKTRLIQNIWMEVTEEIAEKTWALLGADSAIKLISGSGIKRVSRDQIKQLSGMRGLMVDPLGRIVPLPTKSNFREGLSVFEYVTGSRGTRKGLIDTALRTADAGYLTRRLVDAAHSCIVREKDCKTSLSLTISKNDLKRGKYFGRRIFGRTLAEDVVIGKKVLAKKKTQVDEQIVELILKNDIQEVKVYSPLYCKTQYGVCAKCYGTDLATHDRVKIGVPAGVIAAQSVGEPGTQLTMRTKHIGGVVGLDVTQGLPRVQELLEIRTPKIPSPLSEIAGKVRIKETESGYELTITGQGKEKKTVTYILPLTANITLKDQDLVGTGTQLCSGNLDLREILLVRGLEAAQTYLIEEVQAVYESQGIHINDKHFEILVREMSGKTKISNPGDSDFLYGEYVEKPVLDSVNKKLRAKGKNIARGKETLLGLIQAALNTNSWLSAASFQETSGRLTESALLGKIDNLIGMKENVIIGRLIPTNKERVLIDIN
jgi:DNA-directed RNA polymerase subunit beta'